MTRVVNVFYLVNTVLQFIPSISTNSPLASLIPVLFVIILGIVKEIIVECKRWRDDQRVNSTKVQRFKVMASSAANSNTSNNFEGLIETTTVDQIKVGDILYLKDDEGIPADCILLSTCGKTKGEAFV
jgi:phospholipid-translocating ATPase/phospholipid-transporting ATPase